MELKTDENRVILDAVQAVISYSVPALPKNVAIKICILPGD
jgi:hypothetical protein